MKNFIVKQNKELRDSNYIRIVNKKIQTYIKNGCIGNLKLDKTPIIKLPSNLKYVYGELYISYTNITELPNNLKYIGDDLYITHTKISELPSGLIIDGDLWCRNSKISELPNDIIIKGNLWCIGTPLSKKYTAEEIKNKFNIHGKVRD